MTSLLIQKLRDADSGSREIDALIFDQVKQCQYGYKSFKIASRIDPRLKDRWDDGWRVGDDPDSKWPDLLPAYTTSLDAIIGLIEEKLPGWNWIRTFNVGQGNGFHMCLVPNLNITGDAEPGVPLPKLTYSDHADTILALNIALLAAIEQLQRIDRHKRALSALEGERAASAGEPDEV